MVLVKSKGIEDETERRSAGFQSNSRSIYSSDRNFYSVFHQFRQAKFGNGGCNFKLEPIFTTALAASKNEACVKRGQNRLKNNWLSNNDLNP